MKWIVLIFLSGFLMNGFSQDEMIHEEDTPSNHYPEGVYLTFESFLERQPSNSKRVEARHLLQPKQRLNDPLIDNCYFNYRRTGKRVKDAFAISHEGSLYIRVKGIQNLMIKKDKKQKIDYKDSFIRVIGQGKYLYLEGYFRKGGGIGFAVGGGPISVGTGGPKEELKGIVFDFDREVFDLFRDCKDFNEFLKQNQPDKQFECSNKSVPVSLVRKIIFEMNSQP